MTFQRRGGVEEWFIYTLTPLLRRAVAPKRNNAMRFEDARSTQI